ncbi:MULTISPECIES: hypothetical protein [Aliiglaciecola]|uniref:hypothetical protein n=1 Tax=Aliiglaciecola TaxID=1406885 RepID=UPI001C095B0A|nr:MULTISPECIES: hypothetical protein [Aliiglaciecola]MBU2878315.1 hypothetical protein [Aliiglaciecola lipolytica]MDO6711207.1 hypothetical protein [Aliiglaciecola sp. 2_MG-2023]MDO6752121.1 hypothetical protein [Aliiglaciecola sp. 1_MG-2023]
MDIVNPSSLQQEWTTLQYQYDSYEKFSLLIKVFSVILCSFLVFHVQLDFIVPSLCIVFWMLDGIWKTFQGRISQRLLAVEKALLNPMQDTGMQYNSQWEFNRPSSMKLIVSYATNALTPTVLVPHLLIILIALMGTYIS